MAEEGTVVAELMKMMVEDHQRRDEEIAEERIRRKEESRKQLELLAKLVENASTQRETTPLKGPRPFEPCSEAEVGLKLTKLSDANDIAAYLANNV